MCSICSDDAATTVAYQYLDYELHGIINFISNQGCCVTHIPTYTLKYKYADFCLNHVSLPCMFYNIKPDCTPLGLMASVLRKRFHLWFGISAQKEIPFMVDLCISYDTQLMAVCLLVTFHC